MRKSVITAIIFVMLTFTGGAMSSTLKQFQVEYSINGTTGIYGESVFAGNSNEAHSKLRKQKKSLGQDIVIRSTKEIKK